MATTKLQLYNGALLLIGERNLASLTEECEARRKLDEAWAQDFVSSVLMDGMWKFAKRTAEIVASSSITPPFGYSKAFEIPEDFVRAIAVCSDPYLNCPITAYDIEDGCILSDMEPIYLSYVSNDPALGGDLSKWPTDFCEYAMAYLAAKVALKLTQDDKKVAKAEKAKKDALLGARNGDAMDGPTKFPPVGTFLRARMRGGAVRRDRGYRNKLTG